MFFCDLLLSSVFKPSAGWKIHGFRTRFWIKIRRKKKEKLLLSSFILIRECVFSALIDVAVQAWRRSARIHVPPPHTVSLREKEEGRGGGGGGSERRQTSLLIPLSPIAGRMSGKRRGQRENGAIYSNCCC